MYDHLGPDSYPRETAGAEQLDHRVRPITDDVDSEGRVVRLGLESTGYATWLADDRNEPGTPLYGPSTHQADHRAILVPQMLSAQSELERMADHWLAWQTGDAMRLEVMVERTRANGVDSMWDRIVKADRVAWRGKARFRPISHRYSTRDTGPFVVDTLGVCVRPSLLVTEVVGRGYRFIGHATEHGDVKVTRRASRVERVKSDRARTVRANVAATGKRGKLTTAWQTTERNLRKLIAADQTAAEQAVSLESILRTTTTGATLTLSDGHTVTVHASTVDHDGRTFPIREWARRAAMSRVTID